jgi:hypothetical protein
MGRYSKGILGPFSGKIGTVIGSSWKGIDYMRSLPKPSSKAASAAQLEQRVKFLFGVGFLQPISALVNLGFKYVASGTTGFNVAISKLLKGAITGAYPNYEVDYANLIISEGSLAPVANVSVTSPTAGKLTFSWANNSTASLAKPTDKAMLLVYNSDKNLYSFTTGGNDRSMMSQVLDLDDYTDDVVHCWIAFISADGRLVSTSAYAGTLTIS